MVTKKQISHEIRMPLLKEFRMPLLLKEQLAKHLYVEVMYLSPKQCKITYSLGRLRDDYTQMHKDRVQNKSNNLSQCTRQETSLGEAFDFQKVKARPTDKYQGVFQKGEKIINKQQKSLCDSLAGRESGQQTPPQLAETQQSPGAWWDNERRRTDGRASLKCYLTAKNLQDKEE